MDLSPTDPVDQDVICEANELTPEEQSLGISAEEMEEVENLLMQRRIQRVNWEPIIYLQTAMEHIELGDREGRSKTFSPKQEIVPLLLDMGCCLETDDDTVTTVSWAGIDQETFSLVHDMLQVIKDYWYGTTSGCAPKWFCEFICPLNVDTMHVIWICKFLTHHKLEVYYHPPDERLIQRLTLFFGGKPDYRRFCQFQLDKVLPIERLYPENSGSE